MELTGSPVLSRIDGRINFDWWWGSPSSSVNSNKFSARWTGKVEAPASGLFTFTTTTDDGVRLWIDGQLVINNWVDHSAKKNKATINLSAGQKVDVKMEYYENRGVATAKLGWTVPGKSAQIIPKAYLYAQ